jgi:hypothetical protein
MEKPPAPGTISDIILDSSDPERVYVSQYSYRAASGQGEVYARGFFFSEDGGRSWTNLTRNWKRFATSFEFSPTDASTHGPLIYSTTGSEC